MLPTVNPDWKTDMMSWRDRWIRVTMGMARASDYHFLHPSIILPFHFILTTMMLFEKQIEVRKARHIGSLYAIGCRCNSEL
jgi:hypothetical protein